MRKKTEKTKAKAVKSVAARVRSKDKPASGKKSASAKTPPARSRRDDLVIVALGASAKGLEAFERFFKNMPRDSGMAFVLIQHLDPTHESMLVNLVSKYTAMEVRQVRDGMKVEPDHVYVIPPNRGMTIRSGKLVLKEMERDRVLRLPIDAFFRSLADDAGDRSVAAVLSGTGSDGMLGVKEVKGRGGLVLAQDPETTEYSSMPRAAIDTGVVDLVLAPEMMPTALLEYRRTLGHAVAETEPDDQTRQQKIGKVVAILKSRTGNDFSSYKISTLERRIARRVNLNKLAGLDDYIRFLNQDTAEVEALFREILIGVTSFFRDRRDFEVLQKLVIPRMMDRRPAGQPVRVWVPGCSTGEEAYSIAILLLERMSEIGKDCEVQVFATDIDGRAIDKARAGLYPDNISADVPARYLDRWFTKETGGYRARGTLRDSIIFAVQNVLKDPPFSKLDLISCRNLLIYLNAEQHIKLTSLFHYALNPSGYLFLGSSESPGEVKDLFERVDRKAKIFRRKDTIMPVRPEFEPPGTDRGPRTHPALRSATGKEVRVEELALNLLLDEFTPPSVVVGRDGEIYFFHGQTGGYLEPAPGKASLNLFTMARKGLKVPLTNALRKALKSGKDPVMEHVSWKDQAETRELMITVRPLADAPGRDRLFLVAFAEPAPEQLAYRKVMGKKTRDSASLRSRELEQELSSTREYLQTTIEELETSNEELKSTNEEYQSANEELQSTNEELQTSKEELQSVNEELITVNTELENKIEQLTAAYNDMRNLLSIIEIGTLILDTKLRIKLFSQSMVPLISVIPSDLGRPVADIATALKLEPMSLQARAARVLDTLEKIEDNVETQSGDRYLMRMAPYRSAENVIEGVIITFTAAGDLKKTEGRKE